MRLTSCARELSKSLDIKSLKLLDHYSQFHPSPLSIKQFVEFGQKGSAAESYTFLRNEIPVRLSNIMKEINLLPGNLLAMPSIKKVQNLYAETFVDMVKYADRDPSPENLLEFCSTLKNVQQMHSPVVQTMAQGVLELQESHTLDNTTDMAIQYFLDRFYMSRISIRMLMNQHIMLFEPDAHVIPTRRIGMIDPRCQVRLTIMEAYEKAALKCEEHYNRAPEIIVKGVLKFPNKSGKMVGLSIVYPVMHLHHILFELFKNSMRATVEYQKVTKQTEIPPIEVLVAKGTDDLSIRISDQGGGISRRTTKNMFRYLYSTAPRPDFSKDSAPMAGFGYGLPLSRLYARYFHGDLVLNSYHGHGTDTVIYIKTDPAQEVELLPIFNKTSTKQYRSSIPTADWSDPSYFMFKESSLRTNYNRTDT